VDFFESFRNVSCILSTTIQACRSFIVCPKFKVSLPTFGKFELVFFFIKLLEIFCALESLSFLRIGRHDKFVQEEGLLKSKIS